MKTILKLINNALFGKAMENVTKHTNIKLETRKENKSFCIRIELSYYKFFNKRFVSKRNHKYQMLINKPIYLGLSISDLSKTLMYEFGHDYVKTKYCKNTRLCYMDTDSLVVHVKKTIFTKEKTFTKMSKQDLTLQILK